MVDLNEPEINIDKLASHVRNGVQAAAGAGAERGQVAGPDNSETRKTPQLELQQRFTAEHSDRYHVNDLLKFHDRTFIQNAYRAILKRAPDAAGFEAFIESLRSGRHNKLDILARLRYSPEGRAKKVEIDGLFIPAAIRYAYRVPVLGYLLQLVVALARLPATMRSQQQFEAHTMAQELQISDFANHLAEMLYRESAELHRAFEELTSARVMLDRRQEAMRDEFQARLNSLRQDINRRMEDESEARQEVRSEVSLQGLRLERTIQHSTDVRREYLSEPQSKTSRQPEDAHALDAFYVALEKRFRGSRDEIKKRLRVYVPFLTEARVGSTDQGVLDIGCGRGEWLEVLQQASITAKGIDRNLLLVAECQKRGLDVEEGDALAALRAAEDASLGAVTGFHIVEHLPLEEAISLIDESLRVLRPGGLLVFETPNPQNVLVGSCNFYFDPTHRNPIPPPVLKFFLESRGFTRVDVMELNPSDAPNVEGDSELVQRFNRLFYGPMDYAVIGRKAGA